MITAAKAPRTRRGQLGAERFGRSDQPTTYRVSGGWPLLAYVAGWIS